MHNYINNIISYTIHRFCTWLNPVMFFPPVLPGSAWTAAKWWWPSRPHRPWWQDPATGLHIDTWIMNVDWWKIGEKLVKNCSNSPGDGTSCPLILDNFSKLHIMVDDMLTMNGPTVRLSFWPCSMPSSRKHVVPSSLDYVGLLLLICHQQTETANL